MSQVFADGFESGDFTAWTGSNGLQLLGNDTSQRTGSFNALMGADGSVNECHEDLTSTDALTLTAWVRPGNIANLVGGIVALIVSNDGQENTFEFEIQNNAGVAQGRWTIGNTVSDWADLTDYTHTAYNKLEMAADHAAGAEGISWARWNGVPIGPQLTVIESTNWSRVMIGSLQTSGAWGSEFLRFDDVTIDDEAFTLGQLAAATPATTITPGPGVTAAEYASNAKTAGEIFASGDGTADAVRTR